MAKKRDDDLSAASFSRRRLLETTIAGATASVLAGAELAASSSVQAQKMKSVQPRRYKPW